jgi:hypothetical protein
MSAAQKSADQAAQAAVEGRTPEQSGSRKRQPEPASSAGPHADPALVNPDATPGAGSLPSPGEDDGMESSSS